MNKADLAANLLFGSRGACFCDRCMAKAVNLDNPFEAQRIRSALGESGSFAQEFDVCTRCGRETVVIRMPERH